VGASKILILTEVRKHYLTHFGSPKDSETIESDGVNVEICTWPSPLAESTGVLVATLGGAMVPAPDPSSNHRYEFFALLNPGLTKISRILAELATYSLSEGVGLGDSHSVDFQRPLSEFNEMHQVLLIRPADDFLPTLAAGAVHVEFLEVIPVFAAEVSFKQEHGLGALVEKWEALEVQFWNPARTEVDLHG